MVAAMKSITPTISGLASSLFLNVGLTQIAEKLDMIANHQTRAAGALSAQFCTAPSSFTPRRSR